MQTIVFYSGGICSAYIACRLKDEGLDPLCLFSDTKGEDEDTYRFAQEVARRWGLNVQEASDGRSLYEYFEGQNMIPARQIPACSIALKIKPSQKFLDAVDYPAQVAYGYDMGEEHRAERTAERWKYPNLLLWFPLIEWQVSKAQCFGYFNAHNVAPPRIYRHFRHANCLPCKNFRESDWKALSHHYPEKFAEALAFEERTGLRHMQDGPRLIDLSLSIPKKPRRSVMAEPAFDFEMGCDRCALD